MPGGSLSLSAAGEHWAVATPHTAATDAAAEAFGSGGNAIDAALAAATALAVVYPHMCGVGGDLFALVRDPAGDTTAVISAGAAPAGLDAEAVRSRHGSQMPVHGPDTITVPGAVAGWDALHQQGARLPWEAALSGAIRHAREGVTVASDLAATISWGADRFVTDTGLAQVFFDDETPLATGQVVRQPALAETLAAISRDGAEALYAGPVGTAYSAGLRAAGSTMTDADLAEHRAELADPISHGFMGMRVLTAPAPSQGFVLLQVLALAERLGLDTDPLGPDAPVLARIFAAASHGRDMHLADPRAMRVRQASLLAEPILEALTQRSTHPRPTGDTISLVTADSEGWAVSLIQSLYDAFGSGILEPSTGIVAHDRGACFTLEPGHPNELAPGKRPAHTLMPVMVEAGSALRAVAGTKGGEAQPQINAQNLMRALAMGTTPEEAISSPRWSVEAGVATLEDEVPQSVAERLAEAGFEIERVPRHEGALGHSNLILCGDAFEAAADPRADGSARAD